jgi:hypothetical protein
VAQARDQVLDQAARPAVPPPPPSPHPASTFRRRSLTRAPAPASP